MIYFAAARHEKTTSSRKNLSRLWPPIQLAEKMAAELGRGYLLQQALPNSRETKKPGCKQNLQARRTMKSLGFSKKIGFLLDAQYN